MQKQSFWRSDELTKDIERVKGIIQDTIAESSEVIRTGLEDFSKNNGKMLRPAFLLLAARFGKFDPEKFYQLSAAVEMLHMATLIHDDVIDDSPLRRGLPTLHTRFGKREAVLMGDFLLSRCFAITADHASVENGSFLAKAVGHICGSEISQAEDIFSLEISVRRYLRRIAGKTSLLFSLSFYVGSAESKCKRSLTNTLTRVGYNIGMGFQIIDDILDYTGARSTLGKPSGRDLKEGVITLPLIYALKTEVGEKIRSLLKVVPFSEEHIMEVIRLVNISGAVEKCRLKAKQYSRRAEEEMEKLPSNPSLQVLQDMAGRLLHRQY
jgi:heptaprenyl diphosphate synthase